MKLPKLVGKLFRANKTKKMSSSAATTVLDSQLDNPEQEERMDLLTKMHADFSQQLELLQEHSSKSALYCFFNKNGERMEMPLSEYMSECRNIQASFPDILFRHADMTVQDSVVTMHQVSVHGTHTGPAYGFGPFAPVESQGLRVDHPPCSFQFHFLQGLEIERIVVENKCEAVGPAYFYEAIGGVLIWTHVSS